MSRFIHALVLGAPLALSLAGPALAQDNGPVLLVPSSPNQPQAAPTTSPAYGREFAVPQGTPRNGTASGQAMPSLETQDIHSYPATQAQPMASEPTTVPNQIAPQAQMVTPMANTAATDARSTIAEAEATIVRLTKNSGFKKELGQLIDRARAIMVIPSFYKAGFILGASHGNGLLMSRGTDGTFSDPAFYSLTAGSVGFQAGLQENEVIMAIMTDRGLRAVMEDQFKGGANASVTFFMIGGGAEASTTLDVGQDIYAFSHSVGLFGGASLEGTAIQPKTAWNDAIYGVGATPNAILIDRTLATPLAQGLKRALVDR